MNQEKFEIELLERQAKLAWEEEKVFQKVWLKRKIGERESICQGISRNLQRRLWAIFEIQPLEFQYKEGLHIVLLVKGKKEYVVDGSIKQFLPKEKRNVWSRKEYPLMVRQPRRVFL